MVGNEEYIITGENVMVESLIPSIMEFDKPVRSTLHPTMKPVALVEHCLINSSRSGDLVLDPFGGSGTTLIACEARKRRARLLELDPRFGEVIIKRWQEYSGGEAILDGGQSYDLVRTERLCRNG